MTYRPRHRPRHRRVLYAAAGAVLALIAAVIVLTAMADDGAGGVAPVELSAAPLGLNVGPWDGVYAANTSAGGGVDVMQPLLKAAGIGQLRYGGGGYADVYDWQTNTERRELPARRHHRGFLHVRLCVFGSARLQPVLPPGQGDRCG